MTGENGNLEAPSEVVVEVKPEDVITDEIINGILQGCNRPNLELVNFDVKAGTVAGDNYMSVIYAVNLHVKNASTGKEEETIPVMLKVLPQNEFRKKMIKDGNVFVKDVEFYQKLAPFMEKFQKDAGLSEEEIFRPWPKCYASKTDGENDFIAMEDLKTEGFTMANRQVGLDLEHCKLALKAMAKYHALSYAMFQGDYDTILEEYPWLTETMWSDDSPQNVKDMLIQMFQQQEALLKEIGEEKSASNVKKFYENDVFKHLMELVRTKVKWAVINHGDCWINNIMFRYDEETKKPVEIKFVDFQMSRAASRGVDFNYFMYSSPKLAILNEKEEELRQTYFEEFTKFGKKLGVDIDAHQLTKENLTNEFETCRYFGVTTSLMMALMLAADSSNVPDMEQIKEEDVLDGNMAKSFYESMKSAKGLAKVKCLADHHLTKCPQLKNVL